MYLDRVATLLHILDKSRQWPVLAHLHDAAMRELVEHAQDAKDDHEARLEAEKQQRQRQAEKEAAEARRKAEAEEAANSIKASTTRVEVPNPPRLEPAGERQNPQFPEAGGGTDITDRVHGDEPTPRSDLLPMGNRSEPTAEERPE